VSSVLVLHRNRVLPVVAACEIRIGTARTARLEKVRRACGDFLVLNAAAAGIENRTVAGAVGPRARLGRTGHRVEHAGIAGRLGRHLRYESQPARVGQQSVRLRRNYQILSATSFSVGEEISIDGGPFQRLGNGAFSKK
jgi:hypothetical protein